MARLPRFPAEAPAKGKDLNLILSILDTGGVIDLSSVTASTSTGDGLSPTVPNVSGSISPQPGGIGAPVTPRGFFGSYGIDNYAQAHTAFVVLSWTPNPVSDFVSRYDIYYHKGSDPTLYNLSVSGDVHSCRVNNLFPGNSYSFAMQAHDASNRASSWTPEIIINISQDTDPPAVPTGLTATGTDGGVYLTWTEVGPEGLSNDLKEYQIAVSTDGGVTYPLIETIGPGNSFFYTPTTSNQGTVFFKIATVDWTGNVSAYTSPVSAAVGTILGPITINPGGLTVTTGDVTITAGNLKFGAASAKIIPGATSILFRNTGDSASNIAITDAGAVTFRAGLSGITTLAMTGALTGATTGAFSGLLTAGSETLAGALSIPPVAAGTVAPTSYGSVPVKIDEKTPTTGGTTTFSSIPGGFRHLLIEGVVSSDTAATVQEMGLQFNGDTTSGNYMDQRLNSRGAVTTSQESGVTARASIRNWYITAATAFGSGGPGTFRIWIPLYADSFFFKTARIDSFSYFNTTFQSAGAINLDTIFGVWNSGSAITSVTVFAQAGNFINHSVITLYGIP
jgi:hypothetical protein